MLHSVAGRQRAIYSNATSCINSITRLGLPGTRNRGRPRKTWSACMRNDMTICNLDGVNPLDRNSWRTSVRRCQVLPTPGDNRSTINTKTGYDDDDDECLILI